MLTIIIAAPSKFGAAKPVGVRKVPSKIQTTRPAAATRAPVKTTVAKPSTKPAARPVGSGGGAQAPGVSSAKLKAAEATIKDLEARVRNTSVHAIKCAVKSLYLTLHVHVLCVLILYCCR